MIHRISWKLTFLARVTIILIALAFLVGQSAGSSSQALSVNASGQITGSVTALYDGHPLPNVWVRAHTSIGDYASGATDASGTYTITGVSNGVYKVSFSQIPPYEYVNQWYHDKSTFETADPVTVTENMVTTGINATLELGGKITGRVTVLSTGLPITDAYVTAYDERGDYYSWASVDAEGTYTLTGLGTGVYRLRFFPWDRNYLEEYYANKLDLATADPISVTAGNVITGIDAALLRSGWVTGRVTSEADGIPLSGVQVSLAERVTAEAVGSPFTEMPMKPNNVLGYTDASGIYTVTGLVPGTYTVCFTPSGTYVAECYHSKPNSATADPITVTAESLISGIDAALIKAGQITGTVTSAVTGENLADMYLVIEALDATGHLARMGVDLPGTNTYAIMGLPSGSYRIRFSEVGYVSQYYNAQVLFVDADPVTVITGTVTGGINVVLEPVGQDVRVATSPALPQVLLAGRQTVTDQLFYSLDGGQAWHPMPTTPAYLDRNPIPPLAIAPRTGLQVPVRFMVANAGVVYRSGDYGQTWASYTPSVCSHYQFVSFLEASPADANRLYLTAGCPDDGAVWYTHLTSADAGITWQPLMEQPVLDIYVPGLILSPVLAERLYRFDDAWQQSFDDAWQQSDDCGAHWTDKNFPVAYLTPDGRDAQRLYGVQTDHYWVIPTYTGTQSLDGGNIWRDWNQQPCASSFQQLLAHPTISGVLLMRCAQGIYRSRDGGDSWEKLSAESGTSLAPDYGTPGRILWVKNDDLWASTDEGTTWVLLSPWRRNLFMPIILKP